MRPARRIAIAIALLVFAVLLAASDAVAQTTGGSFGGGDWSGGGGGGGGGGGSSNDDGGAALWMIFQVVRILLVTIGPIPTLIIVVIGVGIWFVVRSSRRGALTSHGAGYESVPRGGARAWSKVDITALRIAIDWRSRRQLQDRLSELARTADTRTKQGLMRVLHATVDALEGTKIAWLYGGVSNFHPMSPPEAQQHFKQLAQAARANFESELVRTSDGQRIEQQAPQLRAHAHEGEGVVVVTLVVAARVELMDLQNVSQLGAALRALRSVAPGELVAIEVVWSPAADEDRMSTLEMEGRYPQLVKIDEASIGGRVFCGFCRGPFPAELGTCPHCGAPAPAARRAAG